MAAIPGIRISRSNRFRIASITPHQFQSLMAQAHDA
jgi:hypothetical protein